MTEKDILFFNSIRKSSDETLDETRRRFLSNPPEVDPVYTELHTQLAYLFAEFKTFCEQNNIEFFLMGGSYIGAVRQGGLIPWDKDGDIGMTRENYNLLKQAISNSNKLILKERFRTVTVISSKNKDVVGFYTKTIGLKGCKDVLIDVIVWDRVDIDEGISLEEFWEIRNQYRTRYSFSQEDDFSEKDLIDNTARAVNDFLADYGNNESGTHFIWAFDNFSSTRSVNNIRILPADVILPLSTITFLGDDYPVCNNGEAYIQQEWGDIWTISISDTLEGEARQRLAQNVENNKEIIARLKEL